MAAMVSKSSVRALTGPGRQSRTAVWAAAVGLVLILGDPVAVNAEPLRVAVSQTPLSLPIYVAESEGYFAAAGVSVALFDVIGGHRSLGQVLDGVADLATSSETVVMAHSFERRDYAVIATFVTSDDDVKIVTRPGSGITGIGGLAGKRVAAVVGASSHYYLDMSLLMDGVDPKSIDLKDMQPENMAEALGRGEVDAISIWEPFPFKALLKVPGAAVLPNSGAYLETFNLIVRRDVCRTRGGDLVKFLRAVDRAEHVILADRAKAQAILRGRLHLEQPFIDWVWQHYNYGLTLSKSLLTTLEGEARWTQQESAARSEKTPNYLEFICPMPLRDVRPSAVSIME